MKKGRQNVYAGYGADDKMSVKDKVKLIIWLLVLAILLTAAVFVTVRAVRLAQSIPDIEAEELDISDDVILYADDVDFGKNEVRKVEFTVRVKNGVEGNEIKIWRDDKVILEEPLGKPSVETAEYREFTFTIEQKFTDTGTHTYTAELGKYKSLPLDAYCTPHITKDMIKAADEVCCDLSDYMSEQKTEDNDELLSLALEWLEGDERVRGASRNENCIIFNTQDYVGCLYEPPSDGTTFGTASTEFSESNTVTQVFKSYDKDEFTAPVYLDGRRSVTNKTFTALLPVSSPEDRTNAGDDPSIEVGVAQSVIDMSESYRTELGYNTEIYEAGYDSLNYILNGQLANTGIAIINTHSGYFKRSDGSYCVYYNLLSEDINSPGLSSMLREMVEKNFDKNDEFYNQFFLQDDINADHTLLLIAHSEGKSIVYATSNLFRAKYQNLFFDNTILDFISCYGGLDDRLNDFLLSHGASAVIGYRCTIDGHTSVFHFETTFNRLLEKDRLGNRKMLKDCRWVFSIDNIVAAIKWGEKYFEDIRPSGRKNFPDSDEYCLRTYCRAPYGNEFTFESYGELSGSVISTRTVVTTDADGNVTKEKSSEPVEDVKVEFWQFMDQSFNKKHTEKTDKDGKFSYKDMKWGVWGIKLTGDGIKDTYSGITFCDGEFDAGEIKVISSGASVSGTVLMESDGEDKALSGAKLNYTPKGSKGKAVTAVCDKNGNYSIDSITPGKYALTVSDSDGNELTVDVTISAGCDYVTTYRLSDVQIAVVDAYSTVTENPSGELAEYSIPKIVLLKGGKPSTDEGIFKTVNSKMYNELYGDDKQYFTLKYLSADYSWFYKDGVISIAVTIPYAYRDGATFEIYNISAKTGKEMTSSEVLKALGYSEKDFYAKVKEVLTQKCDEDRQGPTAEMDKKSLEDCIRNTLSDSNIKAAIPYLNQDGELCFQAKCYWYIDVFSYLARYSINGEPQMFNIPV